MKDQKRKRKNNRIIGLCKITSIWRNKYTIMYISEIYPDNGIKSTVNLVQYFLPEIQLKQYL